MKLKRHVFKMWSFWKYLGQKRYKAKRYRLSTTPLEFKKELRDQEEQCNT